MKAQAILHPRDTLEFEHGEAMELAFLDAYQKGRLHHAWLLTGAQGLGKASFAYRCARFLLGRQRDQAFGPLGMAADDPDARLVSAQSHPDLLVLEREMDGSRLKKNISVDAVREVGEFFSKAPSRSAYRVCIVDSVDDLNLNSANALLKILEEPPAKGVLFLVCHAPGRLLPTIRSRCRLLNFPPWTDIQVASFAGARLDVPDEDLGRLVRLAHGAPGKTLTLMGEGALEIDAFAGRLLERPPPPRPELAATAATFKGNSAKVDGARRFSTFIDCLSERLRERALSAETPQQGEKLAQLWSRISGAAAEVEAVNLDRNDYFWFIFNSLNEAL
ncbi:MAG: DNA polymerase III subunit delta' [Asticcacaulis sp.]